jgi:integrase
MQAWTDGELVRFLRWAETRDRDLAMGWWLLAATGMRRGETLALRWRDPDLELKAAPTCAFTCTGKG